MSSQASSKTLLRHNVDLSNFTTMQVGGTARYFSEPSTEEDLHELLGFAKSENLPYYILGKGSNVIFPDEGFPGLVITLIHYEQERIIFDPENPVVTASAGIHLYRLVVACRERGLGGAEFLCNVPGTVGGGVIMNAGFSRFPGQSNEIGDLIEEICVLNKKDGQKEILTKDKLKFSYRYSNLDGKIVLSATLRLWRRKPEDIQKEIRANFDYRNGKQDLKHPSSGSVFKNPEPPALSAGKLIDSLGLKGLRVGDAQISEKHGNYIINLGNAKSSDVWALIDQIQRKVFDATGISLEPEVKKAGII